MDYWCDHYSHGCVFHHRTIINNIIVIVDHNLSFIIPSGTNGSTNKQFNCIIKYPWTTIINVSNSSST
jgi:hypothetical protein